MTQSTKIQFPRFQSLEGDRAVFSGATQQYVSGPLEKILSSFIERQTGKVKATNLKKANNWWGTSHWGYSFESTPTELDTSIGSSTGIFSLEAIRHQYDLDAQCYPGSAEEIVLRTHGQSGKIHEVAALFFANDRTQRMAFPQRSSAENWASPLHTEQPRVEAALLAMIRLAS